QYSKIFCRRVYWSCSRKCEYICRRCTCRRISNKEEQSVSITKLNGYRLQRMIVAGANLLHENKQTVDAMNVFPVPDGDAGTNMSLTVLAAAKETQNGDALRVDMVAKRAANGALRGARGNSGVITSQLFRGFFKGLEGLEEANVS